MYISVLNIFHYLFLIPQLAFDGLRRSEGRQSVTSWDTLPTLLIYELNIIKIHMNGNLRLKLRSKMKMYNSDLLLQWQLLLCGCVLRQRWML